MSTAYREDRIRAALEAAFTPTVLVIEDESAQHRGHAGTRDGKGHFRVRLVAEAFRGQSLIARHRLVYDALAPLLETDIHALSIDARPPADESPGAPART